MRSLRLSGCFSAAVDHGGPGGGLGRHRCQGQSRGRHPGGANEDDEVFFGPVGHRERCVAAGLELQGLVPREAEQPLTWSPLTGEKFAEIFQEAHLLALQIRSSGKKPPREPEPELGPGEEFVQEARLKLDIFERGLQAQTSSPALKRETYCVLPPERLSPQPATGACLQSRAAVQGGAVSRLRPPRSSAKPRPGTQAHPWRLPTESSNLSSGAEPSGPSGEASRASTSSSSLPAPSKSGVRRTLLKPLGPTRTLLGGKSTSFSGPTTSKSSSLGTPARGKVAPSDPFTRLADTPRPPPSGPPGHGTPSCPKQTRAALAAPVGGRTKEPAAAPLRQPLTPRPGLLRPSSNPSLARASQPPRPRGPGVPSSSSKVGPPPPHPPQGPAFNAGSSLESVTPRIPGRSRLPSGPSLGSATAPRGTPARYSSGGALQPPGSSTHTPLNVRRLSALPTPSRRRMSALPLWPTPRTGPRATSPPPPVASRFPAQVPPKAPAGRPGSSQPSDSPSVLPLALDFASPQQTAPGTPRKEAEETGATPAEAVLVHIEPKTAVPATSKVLLRGRPLVDFTNHSEADPRTPLTPAPAPASDGQLLIDLFDSPEGSQSLPSKPLPVTGQLIDLSSPLISLSPLEDKENLPSPLLKF